MKTIGLAGLKRSGKDTVADFLVQEYGFTKLAFADPMKDIIRALDPYISTNGIRLSDTESSDEDDLKATYPEYRRLLQRIGTEAIRENPLFGESFWINLLLKQMRGEGNYVVSDVRFLDEYTAMKNVGAQIWRIDRPNCDSSNDTHRSETEMQLFEPDRIITNDSDIKALLLKVHALVGE